MGYELASGYSEKTLSISRPTIAKIMDALGNIDHGSHIRLIVLFVDVSFSVSLLTSPYSWKESCFPVVFPFCHVGWSKLCEGLCTNGHVGHERDSL